MFEYILMFQMCVCFTVHGNVDPKHLEGLKDPFECQTWSSENVRRTSNRLNFSTLDFFKSGLCWKSLDAPSLGAFRLYQPIETYIAMGKCKDFVQLWESNINMINDRNVGFT